jgi:hypothetical protein
MGFSAQNQTPFLSTGIDVGVGGVQTTPINDPALVTPPWSQRQTPGLCQKGGYLGWGIIRSILLTLQNVAKLNPAG